MWQLQFKMRIIYILVLLVCYVAGNNDNESEIEDKKRRIIEQLMSTRPVILEGYQLVSRHVGIDVHMYRSYRTVSLVFYRVVNDVSDARFTFQSEELHLNNIGMITSINNLYSFFTSNTLFFNFTLIYSLIRMCFICLGLFYFLALVIIKKKM